MAAKFSLSSARVLSFRDGPDYENPTDANGDNVYEVTVRASDGVLYADRMVRVTVNDDNEGPTIMLVPTSGLSISGNARASVAEGTTAVGAYTASGPDAASARWMLTGADSASFSRSPATGASTALTFVTAPDFETKASYTVTVTATDSTGASDSIDVTVTVTDVEEQGCGDALIDRYDANTNCAIEKNEVITAINDYLDGGQNAPTKTEVIRLINLYLDA